MTYGFLFPAVLLSAVPAAAFLIYVYRRRGRGAQKLVSSVLLLRFLERQPAVKSRFVPPLRFFFELLLTLLLIAAAAGFFKKEGAAKVAVLIDNSFSTTAFAGRSTVIEDILRQARQMINAASAADQFEVLVAAPALRSLTEKAVKKSQAAAALEKIEAAFAEDNLAAALARLAARSDYTKIAVFTDKEREQHRQGPAEKDERFELHRAGADGGIGNLAISGISAKRAGLRGMRTLEVALASFAPSAAPALLRVEALLPGALGYDRKLIEERSLTLTSGERRAAAFADIPAEAAAIEAVLIPQGQGAEKMDAVKGDNRAWLSLAGPQRLAGFIGTLSPRELGLDKLRGFDFLHIRPAEYESRKDELNGCALLIFHRVGITAPPAAPSLFILPPQESSFVKSAADARPAAITGWKESDPLVRYLNLPALHITQLHPLTREAGMDTVIRSTAGAVLTAGEYQGRRIAALGLEVLPFEGGSAPLLSVLTLNILDWLSGSGLSNDYRHVYSPLPESAAAASYVGGEPIERHGETDAALIPPKPGLVLLRYETQQKAGSLVAVNYFDESESNLLHPQRVRLPAAAAAGNEAESVSLAAALVNIALLLILLDIVFALAKAFRGLNLKSIRE